MRTHLRRLASNTGRVDARLRAQCPPAGLYLWDIFNSLARPSGNGFNFISQQEIAAWQSNFRTRLTSWELDALRTLDNIAAHAAAQHQKSKADT